jgi:uncharacterized FAD-dependent dehydrogenase
VGVRVEHPRELIDRMQYGRYAGHKALGSARYSFALTIENRGVYSFCMCPGGYVLPTPPEEGHLCVNGMSFAPRSSAWSNAAVVVGVTPADWEGGPEPLSGVTFQRALERRFFAAGGRSYGAPAQRVTDFLAGRASADLPEGSYLPGTVASDVSGLLPRLVLGHLRAGLAAADRILKGYVTREAVVVGVESLTSTPLRMVRLPSGISTSHPGLFPCGEGSGYAGGLTSSAADGLLTAECVARWLAREGPA